MYIHIYVSKSYEHCSEKHFQEIASFLDGAARGNVQTLTRRTKAARASCRCVRWGTCRSLKTHVLEIERTRSPHVNITAYIQP